MKDTQIISIPHFQMRKEDHIKHALNDENQSLNQAGFERVELFHEALPEINFEDITLKSKLFGRDLIPLFVSSMTAGHAKSLGINSTLAEACERRNWAMGVGSQRRELTDSDAALEWRNVRRSAPKACLLGNVGLTQVITTKIDQIRKLCESVEASTSLAHAKQLLEH